MLHSVGGKTHTADHRERLAAGTVGSENITTSTVQAINVNQFIKPFDPSLQLSGSWLATGSNNSMFMFGQQLLGTGIGSQVSINFIGTAITIYGSLGPDKGKFDVYIDGVLWGGTSQVMTPLYIGGSASVTPAASVPQLSATATTINVADTSSFPASGVIQIDVETITYGSKDSTNFLSCTRGYNNTFATTHKPGQTVYLSEHTVDTYFATRMYRQILWSASNLSRGPHTITVVITTPNASSSSDKLSIEGFLLGGMLGTGTVSTKIKAVDLPSFTTDGNGNYTTGIPLAETDPDEQLIGILGIWDSGGKFRYQFDPLVTQLKLYGGSNTTLYNAGDVKITCVYIGKSI